MHELPFAKSIFHSITEVAEQEHAKQVTRVVLDVGILRDFIPEIVDKYWAYVTKGSIAEDSKIEMHVLPANIECQQCHRIYEMNTVDITATRCPACGCDTGTLLSGRELIIKEVEVEL